MKPAIVFPFTDGNLPESVRSGRQKTQVSAHAVRVQLSKIFKSDGFVHAYRMRRFLEFVVEETLAGRSGQLREYSIALSVFGRDDTFEPGIDPIVRNDARRLRQKLLEYYQQSRRDGCDEVIIDMPKGGYVPTFNAISRPSSRRRQYRLTLTLTRIADGAEIWMSTHEY